MEKLSLSQLAYINWRDASRGLCLFRGHDTWVQASIYRLRPRQGIFPIIVGEDVRKTHVPIHVYNKMSCRPHPLR